VHAQAVIQDLRRLVLEKNADEKLQQLVHCAQQNAQPGESRAGKAARVLRSFLVLLMTSSEFRAILRDLHVWSVENLWPDLRTGESPPVPPSITVSPGALLEAATSAHSSLSAASAGSESAHGAFVNTISARATRHVPRLAASPSGLRSDAPLASSGETAAGLLRARFVPDTAVPAPASLASPSLLAVPSPPPPSVSVAPVPTPPRQVAEDDANADAEVEEAEAGAVVESLLAVLRRIARTAEHRHAAVAAVELIESLVAGSAEGGGLAGSEVGRALLAASGEFVERFTAGFRMEPLLEAGLELVARARREPESRRLARDWRFFLLQSLDTPALLNLPVHQESARRLLLRTRRHARAFATAPACQSFLRQTLLLLHSLRQDPVVAKLAEGVLSRLQRVSAAAETTDARRREAAGAGSGRRAVRPGRLRDPERAGPRPDEGPHSPFFLSASRPVCATCRPARARVHLRLCACASACISGGSRLSGREGGFVAGVVWRAPGPRGGAPGGR
jgi:hypothetical protein